LSTLTRFYQLSKEFAINQSEKTNITIVWKYEIYDQDMEEAGEEFKLFYDQITFEIETIERPRVFEVLG
jgi:hypothetical protein|tara:strand:+ start:229 stop:435 length:207 start_codon:yes stop_codon:yes gene_type:complete